ncbi:acetyltransferase [Peribacillus asahii]|uniref:acetyltransferase n=1 Tax=Peribacillus asahii TaxID=228899 RepID=UPI0038235D8A
MQKLIVIGNGGHAKVVIDIANNNGYKIVACLDDKFEKLINNNEVYFGPIDAISYIREIYQDVKVIIALGNNKLRKSIFEKIKVPLEEYAVLVHSSTIISSDVSIGFGSVVMPGVVINSNSQIGVNSIINTSSIIEHDSIIGDFVHIAPNSTITGSVIIENGTLVGASSTLIPGVRVGQWSVLGAGSIVVKNIPSNVKAMGIPAVIKGSEA